MELKDDIYDKIVEYTDLGNEKCDEEQWNEAIQLFEKALDLIPNPKTDWEAATWVYTALGDCCYSLEDYNEARMYFNLALMCPDGLGNPFICLRMGECSFETGDFEHAKSFFLQAYMLEEFDIFEDEPEKYMEYLKKILEEGKCN